ncbi:hypothetical protein ABZP36_016564 [Zizania latifolia]
MAAVAAFSIRGYAASLRTGAAAEGRRPFGVEDLPPMEAPRFRWWADELAAAVAAGAPRPTPQPSRRAQAKAKAPKKRSMSDLFAAAPPLTLPPPADASGGNEATEEDDDEALCAIIRRTKLKKRKRRLEEAAAAAVGRPESEGNFIRKEAPDRINSPNELDTPQASKKSESVHLRMDKDSIPDLKRRKKVTINNLEKKIKNKKIDRQRYVQSKNASKVGKQHDLKKMLPLHSILKKYTKHTSVKMVKEKNGNTKGTEVIELCRKSVKRVKFAEVNDVLGINKQSNKRPQLESLCKIFSDALGSSSSSSTDMSSDGDKYIAAESSSSHMSEKAFSKTKEASKDTHHEDSLELTSAELSSNLIDLNEALPETTDLNYPYVSDSEEPNLETTQHETLESDVQVIDEGKQNQEDLSFDSHGLACQSLPYSGLERVLNSVTLDTLLQNELMDVAGANISGRPMKSTREVAEPHVSFNLNYGGIQLSTEGEVPPRQSQEHNASSGKASSVHSAMNVQQECRPAAGQTVRLMGKDLAVSTTRGEGFYTEDHPTKLLLELPRQGRPYLSLQAQSFANISTNSASTSQSHIRYALPQNCSHPLSTDNALSEDQQQNQDRFRYLSDSQPHQNAVLGCPPFSNHGRADLHQNSSSPWRRYSDPFCRTAPPSVPILPTTTQHASPSSVYHVDLPQPYGVTSARSPVRPHNSSGFTLTYPGRVGEEGSGSNRDAAFAFPSRRLDNVAARAAVPDVSSTSSRGRYVQRSGPVKLIPGAKHILMPSDSTGGGTSMPVYSCVSFGGRRENVSASHNRGAEF